MGDVQIALHVIRRGKFISFMSYHLLSGIYNSLFENDKYKNIMYRMIDLYYTSKSDK